VLLQIFLATTFALLEFNFSSMENNCILDNLSFASINCNSLNMSSSNKMIQQSKLYGIAKLKADVIFMSDIRLCNRNKVSAMNDISKIFLSNSYCSYIFLHNSTQSKRGTGMLIKSDIPFSEVSRIEDDGENYLLVRINVKGIDLILRSIYGPNTLNVALLWGIFR